MVDQLIVYMAAKNVGDPTSRATTAAATVRSAQTGDYC